MTENELLKILVEKQKEFKSHLFKIRLINSYPELFILTDSETIMIQLSNENKLDLWSCIDCLNNKFISYSADNDFCFELINKDQM